ncbi:hypothetical protein KW786_00520 [Candidatus Parcubacteria bacterium]|nr:hypothetical protein [Candidatus Parcubacteria bacterium]
MEKSEFERRINAAGLSCIGCPDEGDSRSIVDRYLEAYELKEQCGLLTAKDKELLPGVRRMTLELRATACSKTAKEAMERFLAEVWHRLHGTNRCLQPGLYWPGGRCGMVDHGAKRDDG